MARTRPWEVITQKAHTLHYYCQSIFGSMLLTEIVLHEHIECAHLFPQDS
ncbi:hypothetical protein KSF_083500 [Reticulibacter mediterranei]|uniref:Uncharacterized protein n=1 Tax=Reticulibacter mediterranei TaxID=2778369 RepID=A0A8J3N4K4_9CHLR|nr:hypothetical protein [Reticulibacter mediterranei]GHO98302.1 hypothetical protein KSF_083500 [Reticulibacter mediterranei]